jgi:hypothetical protein
MSVLVGILLVAQLATAGAESLVFSEDWSKGMDFSLWKHELVKADFVLFRFGLKFLIFNFNFRLWEEVETGNLSITLITERIHM